MTWAPCPHGVHTRGKNAAKERDSRLFQGHIRGPVTTDRGHPHVGVMEKITMLRKPGHTVGYVGQSGE